MWFLILIPIAWVVVSLTMARLSGWSRLAQHYRSEAFVADETANFRSATIGSIQYHSCLSFGVNDDAMRVAVLFCFRLGHPPLVIPWDAMHRIEVENRLYSHRVKVSIGHPTLVRAALPGWIRYRMPISIRPKS